MKLDSLVNEVLRICKSDRNQENLRKNEQLLWRSKEYVPPIFLRPSRPFIAKMAGLKMSDVFTDVETHLKVDLQTKIFTFTELQDDTPIRPQVELYFGVPFAMSLLGVPWDLAEDDEPWVAGPVLFDWAQAEPMEDPDFYRSGMMPLAHRFYREARALLEGKLEVVFPRWYAGCFDILCQMRGHQNLFLDFIDYPQGVSEVLDRILAIRVAWMKTREALFGSCKGTIWGFDRGTNILADDEVNAAVIGPDHYQRFVLPYHLSYGQQFEDIYFHSCGKLDPMYPLIGKIPNLSIVDVSPVSSFSKAFDALKNSVIYERNYSVELSNFNYVVWEELQTIMRGASEGRFFVYVLLDIGTYSEVFNQLIGEWRDVLYRTRDEFFPKV